MLMNVVGFRSSAKELVEAAFFRPAHQQGDLRRRHRRKLRSPSAPGIHQKIRSLLLLGGFSFWPLLIVWVDVVVAVSASGHFVRLLSF